MILTKTYSEPPFCEKEILRYAGGDKSELTLALVRECIEEARPLLKYKICYRELEVKLNGEVCDFGLFRLESKNLSQNLKGCKKAIVFAATVGIELDRLIAKYSRLSPARALILQAIGSERAEALCDAFCADIAGECASVRPRFSPGYGDLSLESQKIVFSALDCERNAGIILNDSLLMSPSKSVTAFVGLNENTLSEV